MSLKRVLEWHELLALGVAGVIGSSWAYLNTAFYEAYGPGATVYGFAISTALAFLVALCFAEMGSTISREGGEVAFVFPTLGLTGSFIVGWMYILAWLVATCSFYVAAFGFLLSFIIPQLHTIPIYEVAGWPVYLPALLIGIFMNIVAFILNYIGVKIAARAQFYMFVLLMICGVIIAVTAFIKGSVSNFFPPFPEGANPLLNSARFALMSITYITGAELLATVAEETRVRPRIFGYLIASSALIAGAFYILMMVSGAIVMPWQEAVKVASRGLIDEMARIHLALGLIVWLASVLGMITSWIPGMMSMSRTVFALARAGLLPELFERIHPRYGTPTNALVFVLIVSTILGLLGRRAMIWFLDVGGVSIGTYWLIAALSLILTRRRYPESKLPRYFKAPAPYIIGGIAIIGTASLIILTLIPGTEISLVWPYEYLILISWVVLGIIIYPFTSRRAKKIGYEKIARNLLGEYYDLLYKSS